jgi:hypothetical protein
VGSIIRAGLRSGVGGNSATLNHRRAFCMAKPPGFGKGSRRPSTIRNRRAVQPCRVAVISTINNNRGGRELLSDRERKGMEAFLKATAAARDLTTAMKTARTHGLVLVVDLGELADTDEVSVFVAGQERELEIPVRRLRVVE